MLYAFYVVIHTERENKIMLWFACQRRVSAGTILNNDMISWKAFRAFYNGGHYSLRGDIIHQ